MNTQTIDIPQTMIARIVNRFCKSSDTYNASASRRFHNLDRDAKLTAIQLIHNGIEPIKAIRKAKRAAGGAK